MCIMCIGLWVLLECRGYVTCILENSLNEGLCPWPNLNDPGHWNSPLAGFDDVVFLKVVFSQLRILL